MSWVILVCRCTLLFDVHLMCASFVYFSFWCSDLLRDRGSISRSSSPSMKCYFVGTFSFCHFYVFSVFYMFQCVCCSLGTMCLSLSSPILERENKEGRKEGNQGYFRGLEKVSGAKISCDYMSNVHRFCLENVNAT